MSPINIGGMSLLTLEEIREKFPAEIRPSIETLRRYIRTGTLAGRKVGTSWLVSEYSLKAYFEKPSHAPGANPKEQIA